MASYAPALSRQPGPRIVRELTRSRTSLSEERGRVIARLHKGLEDANIKLTAVASDVMGKSAQHMLQGLIEGELPPEAMAEFAQGRMRPKREQLVQALTGHFQAHHRFLLAEHLKHLSELQDSIARLSVQIAERLQPYEEQLKLLETIPGIKRRSSCDHPGRDWAGYEPVSQCTTSGLVGRYVPWQP